MNLILTYITLPMFDPGPRGFAIKSNAVHGEGGFEPDVVLMGSQPTSQQFFSRKQNTESAMDVLRPIDGLWVRRHRRVAGTWSKNIFKLLRSFKQLTSANAP